MSIVIPCFNEAELIEDTLDMVMAMSPIPNEVIVVDGGSTDSSVDNVQKVIGSDSPVSIKLVELEKANRGLQLNAGAVLANSDLLCFLHADTIPPSDLVEQTRQIFSDSKTAVCGFLSRYQTGDGLVFTFTFLNLLKTYIIPLVFFPNLYFLKGFRLFYGDQLICCPKKVWNAVSGFPEEGMMEDAYFCLRVARSDQGRAHVVLGSSVQTSGRRCEKLGFWSCLFTYFHLTIRWALRLPVDRWVDRYPMD